MFEAYVTNLGLYPERGAGVGEYLKFPTTAEEVQALFSRIGIDGKQYEEYFITDYDSDILGLTDHLGEYESLDELNYLAHLLENDPGRAGKAGGGHGCWGVHKQRQGLNQPDTEP